VGGGKMVALATALGDATIVSRIQTIDLVTAVAIGRTGDRPDVTEAGTIARVARETGLVTATTEKGAIELSNPKVRERAAQLLANGTRVIAGTVNHYVYLLQIREDGALVHDPAGARVSPGMAGRKFLHSGSVNKIAGEFFDMDSGRRETAVRRVSTNPDVAAVVNRLAEAAKLRGAERDKAVGELAAKHGPMQTGANNFYATSEFAANNLRLRVTLTPKA